MDTIATQQNALTAGIDINLTTRSAVNLAAALTAPLIIGIIIYFIAKKATLK